MTHSTSIPRRRAVLLGGCALMLRAGSVRAADVAGAATLIASAELALRDCRPAAAAVLFERASRLDDDSATAELGMMRAYLQSGDYATAVAWGRLVAGEHPRSPEAAAWADAVDALARPGIALPARAGALALPAPAAGLADLRGARAERVGCGLIDGARQRLLVPPGLARRLAEGPWPWVVDGTGSLWRVLDAEGGLRPEAPAGAEPAAASRAPALVGARARPGRPVAVLHAGPASAPDSADWPRLAAGLLTYPAAGEHLPGLASVGPAAPDGSPVFDACGNWLGWACGGRLEPAPGATADAACAGGPVGDVAATYGRWYAAVGVIWRAA